MNSSRKDIRKKLLFLFLLIYRLIIFFFLLLFLLLRPRLRLRLPVIVFHHLIQLLHLNILLLFLKP